MIAPMERGEQDIARAVGLDAPTAAEWASSREALAASEPRACRRSCPPGTPALKLAEVVERAGIRLLLATTLAEGVRQRDRFRVRRVL